MNPAKVLIVDGNEIFVETAASALKAAAFEVDSADSAAHAIRQIPVFHPAVILMDIQMPGMDGVALTRQLKADAATRHIVIIAFTSFASKGDDVQLRAAGFDGFIAKPLEVMTLAAQVSFWLEGPETARASRFMWP